MNNRLSSLTSSTITPKKNKKLVHEYSDFQYKVGYFLMSSAVQESNPRRNEFEPQHQKLSELEAMPLKPKLELAKEKKADSIVDYFEQME